MRVIAIKLGIFAMVTAAMTLALASVIGNFGLLKSRYEIHAVFEDATGLLRSDLVTLAGVEVGKVKEAQVENGYAKVTLLVDEDVLVPSDSKVQIRYRNLIGQRVVLIQPGESARVLREGDVVPVAQTVGPLDLNRVFNNLKPLLATVDAADVNTISEALVTSFAARKGDIGAILKDTAAITGELAKRDDKIASLVTNLDTVASELADQREQLRGLLEDFSTLTSTLSDRSGSLDRTLVNLDRATGDFGRLIAGNRAGLDQDLKDLATLLALVVKHQQDLDTVTRQLDDLLRATARGTTYGEWGNLYVFSLCNQGNPGCEAP